MSKVYGVFYTTTGNILVGYGGACGNPLVERKGPHFLGGTIDGSKKSAAFSTKDILVGLAKEVKEEFGKIAFKELSKNLEGTASKKIWGFKSWEHQVYIVYIKIDEYTGMYVDGKIEDGISTKYDQCYSEIKYEHCDHVLKSLVGETDWFKDAIKELKKRHFNWGHITNASIGTLASSRLLRGVN